jgi:hypothetical protein
MFIVFNTLKQAQNYIKRNPRTSHTEGCGCCWVDAGIWLDGNKMIDYHISSYAGGISASATVIGRIKKR